MNRIWLLTGVFVFCVCGASNAQLEPLTPLQPLTPLKPLTLPTLRPLSIQPHSYRQNYSTYRYGSTSDIVVSPRGKYLGNLNDNRYDPNSVSNPYGRYGSKYSPSSVNNPYGKYGSKYSSMSANNPYATSAPKIYNGSTGAYKGKLSANRYDSESISNPYSRHGSKYGNTVNNPYSSEYNRAAKKQQVMSSWGSMSEYQKFEMINNLSAEQLKSLIKIFQN